MLMEMAANIMAAVTWQNIVMMGVGAFLLYLAINKGFEPTLLLPMGFGTLLVNLPLSSALDQMAGGNALRNLVRDVIRQELQGEMGDRISRNLRRAIRQEVAAAIEAGLKIA